MEWSNLILGILALIVPFLLWWLQVQQTNLRDKQKEIKNLEKMLGKLEDDIAYTKSQIDGIYQQLAHRSEYAKLKYQVLLDQIADLNNYLKNNTKFLPRRNNVSRDFPTMTSYEDDSPPTGLF